MKRAFTFALVISTSVLASCSEPQQPGTGIDMSQLDEAVRPQDDLWAHVNGKWIASAEIPADRTRWGGYATLRKETDEQVKVLLLELAEQDDLEAGSEAQKVRDFYRSVLNTDLIEQMGLEPVQGLLDGIAAVPDKQAYFVKMAELSRIAITTPLAPFVYLHPEDTTRQILRVYQDGLGLPSREHYLDEGESFDTIRAAYKTFLVDIAGLAGLEDGEGKAERVYAFEHRLAEAFWSRVENRDVNKTNNVLKLSEMSTLADNLDWDAWFNTLGVHSTDEVQIYQPSYIEVLGRIIEETDLETLKTYAQIRVVRDFARYLPEDIRKTNFEFASNVLYGVSEEPEQWERAVRDINASVGEALGKVYVERYFPPEAKARMDELVANLLGAFEVSIESLDWMSDETKVRAQEKRVKLGAMIGYTNKWKDYSALEIHPDEVIGNLVRSATFEHNREIAKLGGPLDKEEWITNPQTVNAFVVKAQNQIFFPAGYLQPPNFFLTGDDAVNYGAIGTTIGHEIGHAFDDQGRKFDGDGNITDWWTEEDATAYKARAQMLVEQYNEYAPFEDLYINGELTLGENIGDLTGLTIALKAYHMSLGSKEAPVIDGLTGDQRFFISYAQSTRIKIREKSLREQIISDPHSPGEYRVRTVKNMPEFYEAFDVKEGDSMYLPPEKRVAIWE